MSPLVPLRQLQPRLSACSGCIAFRQTAIGRTRPHCARARSHRRRVTAAATEEAVQEVQESSNDGRKVDDNVGDLMTWEEIGQRAGQDALQGYQMLDHSGHSGQPRTAPTRVLPAEESTTTDRPVLLYRDTNAWCPFCERVCIELLLHDCEPSSSSCCPEGSMHTFTNVKAAFRYGWL